MVVPGRLDIGKRDVPDVVYWRNVPAWHQEWLTNYYWERYNKNISLYWNDWMPDWKYGLYNQADQAYIEAQNQQASEALNRYIESEEYTEYIGVVSRMLHPPPDTPNILIGAAIILIIGGIILMVV